MSISPENYGNSLNLCVTVANGPEFGSPDVKALRAKIKAISQQMLKEGDHTRQMLSRSMDDGDKPQFPSWFNPEHPYS